MLAPRYLVSWGKDPPIVVDWLSELVTIPFPSKKKAVQYQTLCQQPPQPEPSCDFRLYQLISGCSYQLVLESHVDFSSGGEFPKEFVVCEDMFNKYGKMLVVDLKSIKWIK